MVGTNVNISKKAQELLIKAAAERKVSVETLASEILNESIQNKFSKINTGAAVEKKYSPNPLANMQPYAYYADPEQPAIPQEDWNMENFDEKT
ncbi:hypothetical protein [Pleurocapsa sp. FMAR1]|uniref:hypothetical protein n=1 Tax=Pleurocapsa sp. FMAR1 TaxID=3040204 RepID=UPI0029C62B41|nr:hypothetical protein [Pleurocapsa sp. FMAR1]